MILNGHVMKVLHKIPDNSIDCIVTSPPYWGLREYEGEPQIWGGNPKCDHWFTNPSPFCHNDEVVCDAWKGDLGREPTPQLFVKHLIDIFEALKPKLTEHGTLWVNLGDTYAGGGNWDGIPDDWDSLSTASKQPRFESISKKVEGIQDKSLIGIPQRFLIGMIDKGWLARNNIIWHKTNPMPESAKDRFTRDFENVFFFAKNADHYFEQQFEPTSIESIKRGRRGRSKNDKYTGSEYEQVGLQKERNHKGYEAIEAELNNSLGRNMRTTWTITNRGYKGAHFAVFPEELVRVPILAGSPEIVCDLCGIPRKINYLSEVIHADIPSEKSDIKQGLGKTGNIKNPYKSLHENAGRLQMNYKHKEITDCKCDDHYKRKGKILDPFFGSGTVGVMSENFGRDFVGIELNHSYVLIASKRIIANRQRLAKLEKATYQRNRL